MYIYIVPKSKRGFVRFIHYTFDTQDKIYIRNMLLFWQLYTMTSPQRLYGSLSSRFYRFLSLGQYVTRPTQICEVMRFEGTEMSKTG